MSPEAWTFFTLQSTALFALVGKGIDSYKKEKKIVKNTHSISNGAIPGLVTDVKFIKTLVVGLDDRVKKLESAD